MLVALSTYSLAAWRRQQNKSLEDTLHWIADHGLKAVEFAGLDDRAKPDPLARAAELRALCDKLHLQVASYCTGAELLQPPDAQRQEVERLKHEVDVAAVLGAPTMRHDVTWGPKNSRNNPPVKAKTFPAVVQYLVPALRAVADYAQSKSIKTSLENHGFYMQASKRVESLLKAVHHPNFGLTIDLGNFLCVNENPVNAVTRLAKYVIMAHVKDFHVRPKTAMPPAGWFATPTKIALRGAIVGHGVIDIPKVLTILNKRYTGYLSLEFEGMEDPPFACEQGLAYLKSLTPKLPLEF
ncbi:MAG: sugar phosphate isomerase/epimerase [Phycisphaeraceae bacterium]|nr:sugar phosphate isomerase/epimerase [Phycisphaeraceae bacterium]